MFRTTATTTRTLLVLGCAASVLTLGACGSKDTASSDASGSAGTSSSAAASASPSGSTGPEDAKLAAMAPGIVVHSGKLEVAPPDVVAQAKAESDSTATTQQLKDAKVTPEGCKAATLALSGLSTAQQPLAIYGTPKELVTLRRMGSADDAKTMVLRIQEAAKACASYSTTMTSGGKSSTIKASTELWPITVVSSDDEVAQKQTASMGSQKSIATSATGHVGDILVQVTDQSGKTTRAQLQADLEAVTKAVKAKA